jgi:hypothetical protein
MSCVHRALLALALLTLALPAAAENAWVASTEIRIIDLERGDVIAHLDVAEDQVVAEIAFDRDGERAWVASMGGLFPVDTATLQPGTALSDRPTCSVSVARGADRLAALHLPYPGEGLADRAQGLPARVTLQIYEASTGTPLAAHDLAGAPLRVRIAPDGERIHVMDSKDAVLTVLDGAATPLAELDLAPDVADDVPLMCTDLGQSPDGRQLAVLRNGGAGAALVLVEPATAPRDSAVRVEDLGAIHRGRGAAFAPDGQSVHVSAIGHLVRWSGVDATPRWQDVGHQFSLVAAAPSGRYLVLATPTFDSGRGSGGVLIADPDGTPLRVVELPDISPYTLAVQP